MLIVAPVCKYEQLAMDCFSEIVNKFSPYNHELLVVCNRSAEMIARKLYLNIYRSFRGSGFHVFDKEGPSGWPLGPNYYWAETISYLIQTNNKLPWLWMEQDATPLKQEWIDALEREYYIHNKPFMGVIEKASDNIREYLVGSAIYPPNMNLHTNAWKNMEGIGLPFDFICRSDIVPYAHDTKLIQHRFRTISYMKNKKNEIIGEDIKRAHMKKSYNYPVDMVNGVLHHGCKDGSLAKLINQSFSYN